MVSTDLKERRQMSCMLQGGPVGSELLHSKYVSSVSSISGKIRAHKQVGFRWEDKNTEV